MRLFLAQCQIGHQPMDMITNLWHNIMQEDLTLAPQERADYSLLVYTDKKQLDLALPSWTDEYPDEPNTFDEMPMFILLLARDIECIFQYSATVNGKRVLVKTWTRDDSAPYHHVGWVNDYEDEESS